MGIFTNDESVEPTPTPKKAARKRTQSSFSRSTQVVASTPTPSAISAIFTSNQAQSVSYSTPRSLTAAAAQLMIKVNTSSLELVVQQHLAHGKPKLGNTTTQLVKSNMPST
jgi:hypothetical protein